MSDEESWRYSCENILVLTADHFAAFVTKSFISGWKKEPVAMYVAHQLCGDVLLQGPKVEELPSDADFARLALYSVSELIYHFISLSQSKLLEANASNSKEAVNVDDLTSFFSFSHVLLRHYTSTNNSEALRTIKNIVAGIFGMYWWFNSDEDSRSQLREVWSKFSNLEFGDVNQVVSSKTDVQKTSQLLKEIAKEILELKETNGGSSLLHEIITETETELDKRSSWKTTSSGNRSSQRTKQLVKTDVELPLSPSEIITLPNLNEEEYQELLAIYGTDVPPEPDETAALVRPVRAYFKQNPNDRIILPTLQEEKLPAAKQRKLDLAERRLTRKSTKQVECDQPSTFKLPRPIQKEYASPTFTDCDDSSPPAIALLSNHSRVATRTTPTVHANPLLRALVRGATSRKNAESASARLTVSQPELPSKWARPVTDETPNVITPPALKERIGAPESPSSVTSEESLSFNDEDSTDLMLETSPRTAPRKRRAWTTEEYTAVNAGVKRFGEGKWREIQMHYPVLRHRTNVAVKDAYRLIVRNPHLLRFNILLHLATHRGFSVSKKMFGGTKSWFGARSLWKPKNIHSLDYLRYLHGVLSKNVIVTEHNQQLLIEVWRIISEILIWGDQNDSKVFDFFLEKNMLTFYITYIRQPSARFIIVQLLQTLNILFENTAQETSIYFLLSNNHVNDIITSKFDFADEEVMAYYISFLKTLSLKLNSATIHFFFNEHTRNFPLLTEALKFDSHPESMVRIAARTITLNVFRVRNRAVIRFVSDRVAPIQFSTFAYNVSRQIIAMDACLSQARALQLQQGNSAAGQSHGSGQQSISSFQRTRERLRDYAANHLDLLHYAADVLQLEIEELNGVVSPILLSRLLLPVYLPSLLASTCVAVNQLVENTPRISQMLAFFLLSHFFVVFKRHPPLVIKVLGVIANGDMATNSDIIRNLGRLASRVPPLLSDALGQNSDTTDQPQVEAVQQQPMPRSDSSMDISSGADDILVNIGQTTNQTDDEKLSELAQTFGGWVYLSSIMQIFEQFDGSSDREVVFALMLLLSLVDNAALPADLLARMGLNSKSATVKSDYNHLLVDKLISILACAARPESKVRPVTVALTAELLKSQVTVSQSPSAAGTSDSVFSSGSAGSGRITCLTDHDLARIESAREESTLVLRTFFKSEDTFVDTFEDELQHFHDRRRVDVERILDDANLLLSPGVSSPLSGVVFANRLPCGEVERSRLAMRVFFTLRSLSLLLRGEVETELPLFKVDSLVYPGDALDLSKKATFINPF